MNSPAAAIAWEIWRKNRHGFLLLFVFLLFCAGLGRLAAHFAAQAAQLAATASPDATELLEANTRASDLREFAIGWSGVLLGLSLLITLVVFALAESTALRGFSGVPSRLFTLPVQTGQLIAVPMALGAGFVALLYFTWSRFIFGSLPLILPADAQMPDGYFLLLLPATLAWFQTLVWILPGFPRTRATLLILLITTVSVLSELPFGELNRWPERKAALMAIYAILVVTAPFAAWLGVTRVRNGEWRDWPALTALTDRI